MTNSRILQESALSITEKLKLLCGFEESDINFGFAQTAALNHLNLLAQEDYNAINDVLGCINSNSLERLNAAIMEAKRKYTEIINVARSQAMQEANNKENQQEAIEQITKDHISAQLKTLSNEEKLSFKLFFLLQSIKQFQSDVVYPDVVSRRNIDLVWQKRFSFSDIDGTKKEQGVSEVDCFNGIYSVKDLALYFETLQNHFKDASYSISFVLSNCGQSIMLGFDPRKGFIYYDLENSSSKVTKNIEDLTYDIVNYFSGHNINALAMHAYTVAEHDSDCKTRLTQLKQTKAWQQINEITIEKVSQKDVYGTSWLYIAAREGDQERVDALLKANANPNVLTVTQVSSLFIAAQNGHCGILQALCEHGAKLNQSVNDRTPLLNALLMDHPDAAVILLKNGADVNLADASGVTPLMVAAAKGYNSIVEFLVAKKVNLNEVAKDGMNALLYALGEKQAQAVDLLISSGADVSSVNENGFTALHLAAQNGMTDIVKIIKDKGIYIDAKTATNVTPLYLAAANQHIDVVKILLEAGADLNSQSRELKTPFIAACEHDKDGANKLIIADLIKAKANINQVDKQGMSPLILACANGDAETVKLMLANGALINHTANDGVSPFWAAANYNHTDVVKLLIDADADATLANKAGVSPLVLAAAGGNTDLFKTLLPKYTGKDVVAIKNAAFLVACENNFPQIVEVLLNEKNNNTSDCKSAVYLAAKLGHERIVKLLIENEVPLNDKVNGETPLWTSVFYNKIEVVKALLEANANVDASNDAGDDTPIHIAALNGSSEILKLLLEKKANINKANKEGDTALALACVKGFSEITKLLLDNGASPKWPNAAGLSPLLLAVINNNSDVVKILLEHKALTQITQTDLNQALVSACSNGSLEIVELLIKHVPADIKDLNFENTYPLIVAIEAHQDEVVQYLLNIGANPNVADASGKTPLLVAIQEESDLGIIADLIDAKADVNQVDNTGISPLWVAIAKEEIDLDLVEFLINNGAFVDIVDENKRTPLLIAIDRNSPEVVKLLIDTGANPSLQDKFGMTALNLAAINGSAEIVENLLTKGIDLNHVFNERTPLISACMDNNTEIVKILLEAGANPDFTTAGKSPLIIAAESGCTDIVSILISKKADVNKGTSCITPLLAAIQNGNADVVSTLLEHGADLEAKVDGVSALEIANENNDKDILSAIKKYKSSKFKTVNYASEDTKKEAVRSSDKPLNDENRFFKSTKSYNSQNTNEMYSNAKLVEQRH